MTQQYPPEQTFDFQENGLGLSASGAWLPLIVGRASAATANKLYRLNQGGADARTRLGYGSGAQLAANVAENQDCLFLATAASTAGSNSEVTKSAVGSSVGTITVSGTANDSYRVLVEITTTGAVGTGRFRYALDRDHTNIAAEGWTGTILIPSGGTYVIPNTGLTLTFVPGTGSVYFEAGDLHRFDTTEAHSTVGDLDTAFAALLGELSLISPLLEIRRIGFAGQAASASAAITIAEAVAGYLDELQDQAHFARAIIDGGSADSHADFMTAKAGYSHDPRVALVHVPGGARVQTQVSFAGYLTPTVPASHPVIERMMATELSESGARVMSGALRGVKWIGADEGLNTQFTVDDRTITLRTHKRKSGFWITKPFLTTDPSSDFRVLQWGFVVDEACSVAYSALQQWIEANLKAKTDGTGHLLEESASKIEASVILDLTDKLVNVTALDTEGHVSGVSYVINRRTNYLTTGVVEGSIKIVPLREADGFATIVTLSRVA
jgi:hypothetical protein